MIQNSKENLKRSKYSNERSVLSNRSPLNFDINFIDNQPVKLKVLSKDALSNSRSTTP